MDNDDSTKEIQNNMPIQTHEQNHKKDFIRTTSLILQVFLGAVLMIKAIDGAFTLFPIESYEEPARNLLMAMKQTTLLGLLITGVHVALGALLIFNLWVPFTLMLAGPLALFAFTFEAMYGLLGLPQVLTGLALLSATILMTYHWGFFRQFFRAQSTYEVTNPESAKAELLLLEEVRERAPKKYQTIINMKEVQDSII